MAEPLASSSSSALRTVIKRLHLSPLNPQSHTPEAISNLLGPHGTVLSLSHWPPPLNGVGEPSNFAFVTIRGDEAKISKAIGRISGSVWKGSKIWVREAKKDYKSGYGSADEATITADKRPTTKQSEKQREGDEEGKKKQSAHPNRRKDHEHESVRQARIITEEDVKAGKVWGWKVTPAGHLLRPMQMRPARPLPPVESLQAAGSSKGKSRESAVVRSRRQIIDPTRYGAVHISGALLGSEDDIPPRHELWVCEEDDGEVGTVRWVRKSETGAQLASEEVHTYPRQRRRLEAKTERGEAAATSTESSPYASSSRSSRRSDSVSSASSATSSSSGAPSSTLSSRSAQSSASSVEDDAPNVSALSKFNRAEIPDLGDGTFHFDAYDPDDEANFSDGYDEGVGTVPSKKTEPVTSSNAHERDVGLRVLRDLFGSGIETLSPASPVPNKVLSTGDSESGDHNADEEEDEEQDTGSAWWTRPARPVSETPSTKKRSSPTKPSSEAKDSTHDVTSTAVETAAANGVEAADVTPSQQHSENVSEPVDIPKATRTRTRTRRRKRPDVVDSTEQQHSSHETTELSQSAVDAGQTPAAVQPKPSQAPLEVQASPAAAVTTPNENQSGTSRRAALLAKMRQVSGAQRPANEPFFQPFARFEPATTSSQAPEESFENNATAATSTDLSSIPLPASVQPEQSTEVKMGSLKDMFKPQEGSGGFSLMGSLGDLIGGEDLDEAMVGFGGPEAASADNAPRTPKESMQTSDRGGLFGSLAESDNHHNGQERDALFGDNRPPTPTTGPVVDDDDIVLSFLQAPSEGEVRDKWEKRKAELTQDYKRRHREAVKKKRRRVEGIVGANRV